jgi:hypothetical protein
VSYVPALVVPRGNDMMVMNATPPPHAWQFSQEIFISACFA